MPPKEEKFLVQGNLSSWLSRASDFAKLPKSFYPRATERAFRKVEQSFELSTEAYPLDVDLDEIHAAVKNALKKTGTLQGLPAGQVKHAPWVLHYPENRPKQWIASDTALSKAYRDWLEAHGRPRHLVSTVIVFLIHYDVTDPTHEHWRKYLAGALRRSASGSLSRWHERVEEFSFCKMDGPLKTARTMHTSSEPINALLDRSGLSGLAGAGNYLREVLREYLRLAGAGLANSRTQEARLERMRDLCRTDDDSLRFPEMRAEVADAFLLPFVGNEPPMAVQEWIQAFLLRHLGHPISLESNWQRVNKRARQMFDRWLVGETLRTFFKLIENSALDRHWKYRKKFWLAFHDAGYIDKAWVILSNQAQESEPALARKYAGHFGVISDSRSAIIFQVRGYTVVEWSHSGKYHVWKSSSTPGTPEMGLDRYSSRSLTSKSDHCDSHHGSPQGRWQCKLHAYLRRELSVDVSEDDFCLEEEY